MKKLKIGVRVSVLDEAISGVIKANKSDQFTVMTDDGFEMIFSGKELVLETPIAEEKLSKGIENTIKAERTGNTIKKLKKQSKKGAIPPMEVDLHIEQLVNNPKQLSNYQILTIQLDTAKYKLEFALSKKIQRIVFIHGVGEGVLRAELEFMVNRYDGLKFYDADYKKYGNGALEVYIPQNVMRY